MTAVNNDFDFKVRTVLWFGILSGFVILLMISLGFWYLDKIVKVSEAYQSEMNFANVVAQAKPDPAIVTLGLEHDALGMRNKRTVSALYMRAYSQFLAIIAGTVISLLGAVFVLARVDSVETRNEVGWGNLKWLLTSASPGVIVTTIGAVLVAGVVVISGEAISAIDAPVFLASSPGLIPLPHDLSETDSFKSKMDKELEGIRKEMEAGK